MLSMAEDLLNLKLQGQAPRLRYLKLVWVTRDTAAVASIGPLLINFLTRGANSSHVYLLLDVHIHITGETSSADMSLDLKGITTTFDRPDIVSTIAQVYDFTADMGVFNGITVGVCGPSSMSEQTLRAICQIPKRNRIDIGGYQLYSAVI